MSRADQLPPDLDDSGPRGNHEQLCRAVIIGLDREVDELDAATLGRLRAVRRTAMESAARRQKRIGRAINIRALGSSFAAVALVVFAWAIRPGDAPDAPIIASLPASLESLPVLSAGDDLEFYGSVEFLLWLESQPEQG